MADSPWVRRVMRQVDNAARAHGRWMIWRNSSEDQAAMRDHYIAQAAGYEARARRRLRALLREKEEDRG